MSSSRPDPVARVWSEHKNVIILGLLIAVAVAVIIVAMVHSGGGVGSTPAA